MRVKFGHQRSQLILLLLGQILEFSLLCQDNPRFRKGTDALIVTETK